MPNNGNWINCSFHKGWLLMLLISSSFLYQHAAADISETSTSLTATGVVTSNSLPIIDNIQPQQQISSNENDEDYMPQKENVLEKSYHGLIRENETLVEITPLIKVDEEKICSLRILKKPYHDMPFEIEMYNNLGILKAYRALNCEKRKNYHFELVAVFCDGLLSAPANVHITVVDINEYAPVFLQNEYITEIDEGFLYKDIIRIEAIDKDCTPLYGDVCKYEILNKDQQSLFNIDNDGSIRNLKPLSYKLAHNHVLNIVAYDCAMKQSAPVIVNIKVRSLCVPQIKNIPEQINYIHQSSKGQQLFPNADLELCDMQCDAQNMNIHTSVILETNHISLGCDREILNCTNNNNNNNHNNNMKQGQQREQVMINLLEKNSEWTKNLKHDNNGGVDDEEPIYHFDGKTGILIPENIMTQHDFASQSFSIVTVFRHAPLQQKHLNAQEEEEGGNAKIEINNDIKHIKEHILCSADDHKMNRHHMALFVRNCRLILLLRKNFNEGDLNIFSPAEWRWKIPQVCDNQWHHYVINVINNKNNNNNNNNNDNDINENNNNNNNNNNGNIKVDLYIDGILFNKHNLKNNDDRHNNPEVIDDWPLHAAQGIKTKLSVGACYQSSLNKLKHTFMGDISVVKVALNGILNANNIKCLTNCAEHFVLPNDTINGNYLPKSTQIQMNAQLNEIYMETKSMISSFNENNNNENNILKLLKQIHYVNNKKQPTMGRRNIEIRTTIMCENQIQNSNAIIKLPTVKTSIIIMMNGTTTTTTTAKSTTSSPFMMMAGETVADDSSGVSGESNSDSVEEIEEEQLMHDETLTYSANKAKQTKLIILGMGNKLVSYAEIKNGVRILSDVNLTFINKQQHQQSKDYKSQNNYYVNACSVVVFPSLNPDHEDINILNDDMITNNMNIKTNINKEGVKMIGHDSINNYMNILHELIYSNKKPAYYLNRVFKLTCHDDINSIKNHNNVKKYFKNNHHQQQQQHTGEYTLTLTVLHPKQQQQQLNPLLISGSSSLYGLSTSSPMSLSSASKITANRDDAVFSHAMINSHAAEESQAKFHAIIHKSESSHSTMLIALMCIFVAILLCGVYVARVRNNKIIHHQPCPKQILDDSLAWDDSALTITINPMQSDAISDASCTDSENSDTDDEEVLKARFSNVNQLEWDNSNIFTSAIN